VEVATLFTFIGYFVVLGIIGLAAWRATRTAEDYILGGRRLGPTVTALSAGASDMSGWLLLGLPGAIYVAGIRESWIVVGLVIGAWCNWRFVAPRLRTSTADLDGALTLPEYFARRFGDRSHVLRLATTVVIILFFTFYTAAGLVAGAKLFQSTLGTDYYTALLIGIGVIVAYTAIGGFLAVSWTDAFQATLMIVALAAVPIIVVDELGGAEAAVSQLQVSDPGALMLTEGLTLMGLSSLLAWGLGYFGQPHILARFMAIEDVSLLTEARRIGMSWMIIITAAAVGVGLAGIAWFGLDSTPNLADAGAETVFIRLSQSIFNPWVAGALLAAILAAVMSTIDSQLLVASSALAEDVYRPWLRPGAGDTEIVWIGRLAVALTGAVAIFIAWNPDNQVLALVSYAWAGLGASFGPVILFSLYWGGMSRAGALAGMLVGGAVVVVWKQLEGGWFDVYEILPGFVAASVTIVIASLLDPTRHASARIYNEMGNPHAGPARRGAI
jgi:sodium/proline symporter